MKRAVVAAVLLAAACGGPPPESGYVYEQNHFESYSYMTQNCISYGKYGCTAYVPFWWTQPERWELCLVDDNDKNHMGCVDIDAATWAKYPQGSHYPEAR